MKVLKTKDEFNDVIKASGSALVVVDFYADWCGPCRMIAPKLEEMALEFTNVIFVKVNVDENGETSEQCGISAMPTFFFYKNGEKIGEVVGASESKIKEMIKQNM